MKKLVSTYCCILCLHSVTSIPPELGNVSSKISGEKTLVKALSALVNKEENKKIRPRRADLFLPKSSWF